MGYPNYCFIPLGVLLTIILFFIFMWTHFYTSHSSKVFSQMRSAQEHFEREGKWQGRCLCLHLTCWFVSPEQEKKNQQQPLLVILFRHPFVHVTETFILTADLYSRNWHQTRSAQLQS